MSEIRSRHEQTDVDQASDQRAKQQTKQDASHKSSGWQSAQQKGTQDQQVRVTVENMIQPSYPHVAGALSARILLPISDFVSSAVVELYFGALVGVPVAITDTDSHGNARWTSLPPGFYSLRVILPDGQTIEQWNVRLDGGREQLVILTPNRQPAPTQRAKAATRLQAAGAMASPETAE